MQTRLEIRLGRGEPEREKRDENKGVGVVREGEAGGGVSLGQ